MNMRLTPVYRIGFVPYKSLSLVGILFGCDEELYFCFDADC